MAIFNGKRLFFSPRVNMLDEEMWNNYWTRTGEEFTLPDGLIEVPTQMFANYTTLVKMNLPDSITKISERAFEGCQSFRYINLPDGITEIGEFAFYNDTLLELNGLPQSLTNLPSGVFCGCKKVKFRSIPSNVKNILAYSLTNCTANNTASIPAGVEKIDVDAFANNLGITEITFIGTPSNLVNVSGKEIFRGCKNLLTINVPWGETDAINAGAPWGATNATINYNIWSNAGASFAFPAGLVEIPDSVLKGNTTVKNVTIGDEVTAIRPYAFNGCSNLETINFPDGLIIIEEFAFLGCPKLVVTELPDSVDEIENAAFAGTKIALSKLPKNIRKLEVDCFDMCKGNTFTVIPESVIVISARAFKENTGLTTLTFKGTPEYGIAANAFNGCTNLTDIFVPWGENEVANAPWGAPNANIHYNHKGA